MEIRYDAQKTYMTDAEHFWPEAIFECGQCFRFVREPDASYTILAHRHRVNVYTPARNQAVLSPCTEEDFAFWRAYFDFGTDYAAVCSSFPEDARLKDSMAFGQGMRILRQHPFETLISFIVSANNNIKRIQGILNRICERYGDALCDASGVPYHAFPTPKQLASGNCEEFYELGAGYRAPYIEKTARRVAEGFDLHALRTLPYEEAKKELCTFAGVGEKVADCVLLFSLGFLNAFPVDVWIKRVMQQRLGASATKQEIVRYAQHHYGGYAGIAQQYLFYHARCCGLDDRQKGA
ncbi:MAG: DNA-3-methyladenine glycosylase family protein [Christensenellales bacterium]|jgi:N-glycosylase/DNA lyase